jgi:hypothetical protein
MDLLSTISAAWGWAGIKPDMVVGENDFGNLIVRDKEGCYWRLCPEDLYCRVVADSRAKLDALSLDQTFLQDWHVRSWVEAAHSKLGPLRPGYKYYLVRPAPLGGGYTADNMEQLSLRELVSLSGDLAQQIEGMPDGAKVEIRVVP